MVEEPAQQTIRVSSGREADQAANVPTPLPFSSKIINYLHVTLPAGARNTIGRGCSFPRQCMSLRSYSQDGSTEHPRQRASRLV